MPDWLDPLLTHADPGGPIAASQANKRTRIVEAAFAVLVREGIAKLSMRRVAKEAGVALGLAHYYFASKSALLAAVIEARSGSNWSEPVASKILPPRSDDLSCIARGAHRAMLDDVRLEADLDSQALREPIVARAAARRRREREAALLARLRASPLPLPALDATESLAAVLLAALDGLDRRAAIDPDFDFAAACLALERLWLGRRAA